MYKLMIDSWVGRFANNIVQIINCLYYANIIKELSPQYKIGLLMSDEEGWDTSNKGFRRQQNTGKKYRSFCMDLGAEWIFVNEKVKGKLVIMPVETLFSESYDRKLLENVSWDKLIGLFTFLCNPGRINRLKDLGATKFIAPAKYLLDSFEMPAILL